jgi:uncharacterized protein DUF6457
MIEESRAGARPLRCRPMNVKEWITAYAERLGVEPPTAEEIKTVLDLAGEAARASERVAAPVTCWVAAKAGRSLEESLAAARELAQGAE